MVGLLSQGKTYCPRHALMEAPALLVPADGRETSWDVSSAQVPGGGLGSGAFPVGWGCSWSLGAFYVALAHAELGGMRMEGEELEKGGSWVTLVALPTSCWSSS